jgi:hypothetical protein
LRSGGTGSGRKSEVRGVSSSTLSVSGGNSGTSDFEGGSRSGDESADLESSGSTRQLAEAAVLVAVAAAGKCNPVVVEGSGVAGADLNFVRRDGSGSTVSRSVPAEGHVAASSSGSDNNWARSSSRSSSADSDRRLTLGRAFTSSGDLVASTILRSGVVFNLTELVVRSEVSINSLPSTEGVSSRLRLDQVAFGVVVTVPRKDG